MDILLHTATIADIPVLTLNIYPAAHTVTAEMERDAVDWFTCHLAAH